MIVNATVLVYDQKICLHKLIVYCAYFLKYLRCAVFAAYSLLKLS